MRSVLDKSCRENQNTHFVFTNFLPENRAGYNEKFGGAREAVDDSIAARCMMDN